MKSVFFLFVVLVILTLSQINAQEYEIDAEAEDFGQFGGGGSNQRELMKEVASEQDAPIIRAASHGDLQLVTEFIRDGQPLNTQNDQGWTAVTYAVANGYTDIVRELVRAGANVNIAERDGWTPLMFAAFQGNGDLVETLVRAGADLNMRNNLDLCAFEIAVGQNQEHLTGFLAEESIAFSVRQFDMANMIRHVRAGAAPNTANGAGWTPLHFASAFGHYDEAHELLYLGANINQEENDGWTALLFASNNNHADIVRLLLENGARADHVSLNNHTARNLAELGGHADVLEVLDSFAPRSDVERTLGEEASQSDADEIRALEDSGKDTITAEATGAVGTGSDDAKRKKNGFFLWN